MDQAMNWWLGDSRAALGLKGCVNKCLVNLKCMC